MRRIFEAKGRPAVNPIIVHAWDLEAARSLTASWPESALRLAERFWPGPLTLVLPKADRVPGIVTAGGSTVAVRVPAHPVALALLRSCQLLVAAPSANRSGRLSPTRGAHVLAGLDGRIDILLDAGPTTGGLESTVLDVTGAQPRLLRPGLVSTAEIEAVIGPIVHGPSPIANATLKSPGLLDRHYAPRTPLECIAEDDGGRVRRLRESGLRLGLLTYLSDCAEPGVKTIVLPRDAPSYAANLYAALHRWMRRDWTALSLPSPRIRPNGWQCGIDCNGLRLLNPLRRRPSLKQASDPPWGNWPKLRKMTGSPKRLLRRTGAGIRRSFPDRGL